METMIEVTLDWHEYAMAAEIGSLRRRTALQRGSQNSHGALDLSWTEDIEGAGAELCVAKALGIYWNGGIDTFKSSDLGVNIQVRWTPSHSNNLIVRDADSDDDYYVLVTGTLPTMRIHGYAKGDYAKNDYWKRAPNGRPPAYFVTKDYLRPVGELRLIQADTVG